LTDGEHYRGNAPENPRPEGGNAREKLPRRGVNARENRHVVEFAECIAKKRLGVDAAASLVEIDAQDLANVLQGTTAGSSALSRSDPGWLSRSDPAGDHGRWWCSSDRAGGVTVPEGSVARRSEAKPRAGCAWHGRRTGGEAMS
jgi:hypothetical protein